MFPPRIRDSRFQIAFWWTMVVAYAAAIFALSSLSHPLPKFQQIQAHHFDKALHLLEYAVFGFLLYKASSTVIRGRSTARLVVITILIGCLYAATDEFHQSFVPMRQSSVHDGYADAVGMMVGIGIALF